jgi:hypothetical protein
MTEHEATLQQLRKLAQLLDSSWTIPGTRWRIGLDPLLGLLPGVGDAAGLLMAMYIIARAKELGASKWTLMRMTANVGIDALVGVVPAVGDLFDAAYKANIRNIGLLEKDLASRSTLKTSNIPSKPA